MSDQIQIVAADAISFIEKFTKAVKSGYRVSLANEDYPADSFVKSVMLFKEPSQPAHKEKMGLKFTHVRAMDRLDFIVQLQQAVIEGYEPDLDSVYWALFKEVKMKEKIKSSQKSK